MVDVPIRGTTYEIVIRGELDARYAYLFDGMQMERAAGTTVLTGNVRDRAQLYGYIDRIEELGLELVSVHQTTQSDLDPVAPGAEGRERNT
jgi:hypothetical protein